MLYLVIGIFVVVAVGAFFRQQSQSKQNEQANQDAAPIDPSSLDLPDDDEGAGENSSPTAAPVTEAGIVGSATYSAHAPAGEESPYSVSTEPKEKPKAQVNLLRWCGRIGNIQLDNITIPSPVAYWSKGEASTPEPSCIDITLPIDFPKQGEPIPADGAESYAAMSPVQRGIYLTWLAGSRIQPPLHMCYPSIWLYGIERRTLIDKLDLGLCINEAFRLLPLLRWDIISENLITFVTWLAVKVWLPDEDLLALCRRLNKVPEGLLGILLNSYANSLLPLPSAVAFTLMRTCEKLHREGEPQVLDTSEALQTFTPIYKDICKGGLVLTKPANTLKIAYTPTNPTINLAKKDKDKDKENNNVVEVPNFFEYLEIFKPLLDAWEVFLTAYKAPEPEINLANIEQRPDLAGFLDALSPEGSELPLITTLEKVGKLMNFETKTPKLNGKERKSIVDTAQVEGWQIVPDLGISGREYTWDDKILFVELPLGTNLTQGYRVAAFILEFICAAVAVDEERVFEPLRQRLNDFFVLSEDDNIRLEAQRLLDMPTQYGVDYYGEFLCAWFSEEERKKIKYLVLEVLSFMTEFANNPEVNSILCEFLKLREDEETPAEELSKTTGDRGSEIIKIMGMLFKNN
ncbi:MAG: TerB N-terminal domain-containing protein [Synergistaceae bacterium]|nr:TerB N-terminal domain-containing protein [Synergistaceae bacterium]